MIFQCNAFIFLETEDEMEWETVKRKKEDEKPKAYQVYHVYYHETRLRNEGEKMSLHGLGMEDAFCLI